jgi:hypothetical protein
MTIASLIGQVDVYSAGVAIAFAVGATVVSTSLVVRYQSGKKRDQDFEIEKLKLANAREATAQAKNVERDIALGNIASKAEVEFKRIEHGGVEAKVVRDSDG